MMNLNLNDIIEDARQLPLVPLTATSKYQDKISVLTQFVNETLETDPSIHTLIGNNPLQIMYDNHKHHAAFMATVFSIFVLTNEFALEKMSELTNDMANMARDLHRKNKELETAWSKIKVLSGIIPICMHCKEIRDDQGYWNRLEKFITENSEAQFSHSICPLCMKKHYPDFDFEN